MKIIVVADKKASEFLKNPWNIGAVDMHTIITGNIADGISGAGRFAWDGKRWVDGTPPVVVHNRQVTKISEIQNLISGLLIGEYETAIIGCDPSDTAIKLTRKLREVFGSENVTEIYPYLDQGFSHYRSLTDRVKKLLGQTTVERVETGTEGTVKKQSLYLKISPADTENVINIIFDEGTHLELDFRGGTQETA